MFCANCGYENPDGAGFCCKCGAPLGNNTSFTSQGQPVYYVQPTSSNSKGLSISSLVLGICGLIMWLLPILGLPVTIVGLILGIIAIRKGERGMAIAGVVLSSIGLLATLVNGAIGAYMGATGQLSYLQAVQSDVKPHGNMAIMDEDNNLVITVDDVESVEAAVGSSDYGTNYVVNMTLTKSGADVFKDATLDNYGKQLYIYVDYEVVSAPWVNTVIADGNVMIDGFDTYEKAEMIAEAIQGD